MAKKDSLGDRMKNFENNFRPYLIKKVPVIIRLDGRSFHNFTKKFEKPFDSSLASAMIAGAYNVAKHVQGFKCAYIQSDEVSILMTDFENIDTQAWFDYNLSKIITISSTAMSNGFNAFLLNNCKHLFASCTTDFYIKHDSLAMFDCRAFNVPKEEVANAFLWRLKDWERNSLQMYARSFFSHKELNNKNCKDIHDMLFSIGKNWTTDLANTWKNGTWLIKTTEAIEERVTIQPNFKSVNEIIEPLLQNSEE
jgi:tRNA(His) 5'-end guanylyltransferase